MCSYVSMIALNICNLKRPRINAPFILGDGIYQKILQVP